MKKIVIAVLAFVLLLTITNTNAQRFEHHNAYRENRREVAAHYTVPYRNYYRANEKGNYRRDFERGKVYYNQPRIVYATVPVVIYASYNQVRRLGYYYYPSVNVYFSPFSHLYIYQYNGGWVSGDVLPHGIYINEPYTQVYCNMGENIWMYNNAHIQSFRRSPVNIERPVVRRPFFERRVGNGPRGHR